VDIRRGSREGASNANAVVKIVIFVSFDRSICLSVRLSVYLSGVIRYLGSSTVITLRGDQLDIAVQPKNQSIEGLLGNNNGVASDDLISRNGETVNADSTEETIYYEFGETCELSHLHSAALVFTACAKKIS